VIVSLVVALAAILGGAFYPGPRVVIGVLLAVALGWAVAVRRGQLMSEEWVALGFVVWGVVSAALAAAAPLAARETITVWMVAWGLWIVARRARESNSQAGLLILTATSVILAFGVVLEAVGLGGLRVGGLLENPNVTASLLVVSLPAVFVIEGRQRWRFAVVAVLTLGLMITGSRAGLLAMLAVVAVVLPRGRVKIVGLLTSGIGVIAVLLWRFVSQPDILAWFRPAIWYAMLRLWVSRPLCGVGPGGLADAAGAERLLHADHVGQRQFLITYAESSPMAVLVQTGLVGLLIAIVVLFIWWRRVHGNQRLSRPMAAALAAMAVMSAFHDLLTMDVVLWWWALSTGLMEVQTSRYRPDFFARCSLGSGATRLGPMDMAFRWAGRARGCTDDASRTLARRSFRVACTGTPEATSMELENCSRGGSSQWGSGPCSPGRCSPVVDPRDGPRAGRGGVRSLARQHRLRARWLCPGGNSRTAPAVVAARVGTIRTKPREHR